RRTLDDRMRVEAAPRSDADIGADDGEGVDTRARAEDRLRVDLCGRMDQDRLAHGDPAGGFTRSTMVERISASATRTPSTDAAPRSRAERDRSCSTSTSKR